MNIKSIRFEEIGTIISNETPFKLRVRSKGNKVEPLVYIPPKSLEFPYIQKYPERSGSLITLSLQIEETQCSIHLDYSRLMQKKGYLMKQGKGVVLVSIIFKKDKKVRNQDKFFYLKQQKSSF